MSSTLKTENTENTEPAVVAEVDTGMGRVVGVKGEIDPSEAELASRLRMAVTRLHRRLRQQAAGGLTPSQASALVGVEHLGSPTLGALAARESVQPPTMTKVVGALEELGYVTRVTDPSDRRVARLTITPTGSKTLREIRSLKTAFLAGRVHRLDPADRLALNHLTDLLERLVDMDEL
jgi:DNA-binding MarR family transcriptional regulator